MRRFIISIEGVTNYKPDYLLIIKADGVKTLYAVPTRCNNNNPNNIATPKYSYKPVSQFVNLDEW